MRNASVCGYTSREKNCKNPKIISNIDQKPGGCICAMLSVTAPEKIKLTAINSKLHALTYSTMRVSWGNKFRLIFVVEVKLLSQTLTLLEY